VKLSLFRRIPAGDRAELEAEGIVQLEELVRAIVSSRYLRLPGAYIRGRVSRGKGSIAITEKRLYVHTTWTGPGLVGRLVNVGWAQAQMAALAFSVEEEKLVIEINDVSRLREDGKGKGGFEIKLGCADPAATLALIEEMRSS
jgi:hypothetical protein